MKTSTLRGLRTALIPSSHASASTSIATKPLLLQRWASSSPAESASPTYEKPRSLLNGPSSTLPAQIVLPPREPAQSTFKYLFSTGKAYLGFYKTGAKNIYHNARSAQRIQNRIDREHNHNIQKAVIANALTRADFLLLHRSRHDVKRVPLFGLVFLMCGEFTPLVVLAISNIVPWTCRIPRQIEGDRRKLEARRAISFRNLTLPPPSPASAERGVEGLQRQQLIHVSWSLGLSSKVWDWLGGRYPGLPSFVLRRKVGRRVAYLEMDDKLLGSGERVGELEDEEVRVACVERGVNVLDRPIGRVREDLRAWLGSRAREGKDVITLLLTRPSVWPVRPRYMTETK